MRRLLMLLLAVGLALPLAACGRKSTPLPAEGAFYPYTYPYTPFPKRPEEIEAELEQQRREAAGGEDFTPPAAAPSKPRSFQLERPGATTQQQPAK